MYSLQNSASVYERDFNENLGMSLPLEIEVPNSNDEDSVHMVTEDESNNRGTSDNEAETDNIFERMSEEHFNTTTIFESLCSSSIAGINTSPPVVVATESQLEGSSEYVRNLVDLAVDGAVLGGQVYQPNMINFFDRKIYKDLSWLNKLPMITTQLLSPYMQLEYNAQQQTDLLSEFGKILEFLELFFESAELNIMNGGMEYLRFEFYYSDDFQLETSDVKYPYIDFFEVVGVVESESFLRQWCKEKLSRLSSLQEMNKAWICLEDEKHLPDFHGYTPEMKTYLVLNAELLTCIASPTQTKGCITKRIEEFTVRNVLSSSCLYRMLSNFPILYFSKESNLNQPLPMFPYSDLPMDFKLTLTQDLVEKHKIPYGLKSFLLPFPRKLYASFSQADLRRNDGPMQQSGHLLSSNKSVPKASQIAKGKLYRRLFLEQNTMSSILFPKEHGKSSYFI